MLSEVLIASSDIGWPRVFICTIWRDLGGCGLIQTTQLVSDGPGIHAQAAWLQSLFSYSLVSVIPDELHLMIVH